MDGGEQFQVNKINGASHPKKLGVHHKKLQKKLKNLVHNFLQQY